MNDFVQFILGKVYRSQSIPNHFIESAFVKTIADIHYHFPTFSVADIERKIQANENELAVFLFRLGSELRQHKIDHSLANIHWLLKELCACEIYFSNDIDTGFYVVHGAGTIIGSRNKIGKGFKIHQGCTIGHKKNGAGNGSIIGDNVTVYCNSTIVGELNIGNNVIIGANLLITDSIESNKIVVETGNYKTKDYLINR